MEEEQEESLETFLKWAIKLGITDSPSNPLQSETQIIPPLSSCLGKSLFVSQFPDAGGRGLAAARDLRKHELILRVPKSALMTRESLMLSDQKLSLSIKRYPHLSSTQILSVCLLAEMGKGRDSWWYPYLMQLPRQYETLTSFTRFETQALQVDGAIWTAERAISKAEMEWREAIPLMQELELRPQFLTFRSWLWSSATISSRTLHVPRDDAGCLCPVGDLFNYAVPGEESFCSEEVESWTKTCSLQIGSSWTDRDAKENLDVEQVDEHSQRLTDAGYEEDSDAYCFYARKRYSKGEQVLLGYGTYTNLELLEYYGFLLNANLNDKVFIQLEPDINSNSWPKDSIYIQHDGKPSFALLSALRLWATPPNHRKSVGHLVYSGAQLSTENEISVMRWVRKNCKILLEKVPSSIEDDVLLLKFIEEMQDHPSLREVKKMLLACEAEIDAFFEATSSPKSGNVGELPLSRKARRSIERWKLAVQWRLRYKQILVDCVSYCTEVINFLSSQQISSMRTIVT
ncbi:SET domain [Macleaya cordata]|uniref:SET domain n=1 Tax=Macleaya cordata TaxID=56857 RepID=A0A200QUX7_MACCD|nr:SET domain [Macleaya cordata]